MYIYLNICKIQKKLVLIQIYKLTFVLHGPVIFNTSQIPNLALGLQGWSKNTKIVNFKMQLVGHFFGQRCHTLAIANDTPQIPQKC